MARLHSCCWARRNDFQPVWESGEILTYPDGILELYLPLQTVSVIWKWPQLAPPYPVSLSQAMHFPLSLQGIEYNQLRLGMRGGD